MNNKILPSLDMKVHWCKQNYIFNNDLMPLQCKDWKCNLTLNSKRSKSFWQYKLYLQFKIQESLAFAPTRYSFAIFFRSWLSQKSRWKKCPCKLRPQKFHAEVDMYFACSMREKKHNQHGLIWSQKVPLSSWIHLTMIIQ